MIISLSELMSVKGKVEHIQAPIELGYFTLEGIEYPFNNKKPVDLVISHLGDRKVEISVKGEVSLLIPCSRCLSDVLTEFDFESTKVLDFNQTDEDRIKEMDETNFINGYNLDVDLLVYDEIMIDFPMKVLCGDDCKGFCYSCGKNLNLQSCGCEEADPDPRMSAIRDIFSKFKEV